MRRIMLRALTILGAVAGWGAWGYLIAATTPELWINRFLFFLLLFIALFLTATTAAYWSSFWLFSLKRYQGSTTRALFQGIPVALMITGAAWLQSLRLLSWSVGLIMVAIVCIVELLLLPRQVQ